MTPPSFLPLIASHSLSRATNPALPTLTTSCPLPTSPLPTQATATASCAIGWGNSDWQLWSKEETALDCVTWLIPFSRGERAGAGHSSFCLWVKCEKVWMIWQAMSYLSDVMCFFVGSLFPKWHHAGKMLDYLLLFQALELCFVLFVKVWAEENKELPLLVCLLCGFVCVRDRKRRVLCLHWAEMWRWIGKYLHLIPLPMKDRCKLHYFVSVSYFHY